VLRRLARAGELLRKPLSENIVDDGNVEGAVPDMLHLAEPSQMLSAR
jgi:hypothetical protein